MPISIPHRFRCALALAIAACAAALERAYAKDAHGNLVLTNGAPL